MNENKKIRIQVYRKCVRDLLNRIISNPKPKKEEILLGAYMEMLEPQVKEAVLNFNQKGYPTNSSGFYKKDTQSIDGFFTVDKETKNKIQKMGVKILEEKTASRKIYTTISFKPVKQEIQQIKKQWNEIAKLLPKQNKTISAWNKEKSEEFKKRPISEAHYFIGVQEHQIVLLGRKNIKNKRT